MVVSAFASLGFVDFGGALGALGVLGVLCYMSPVFLPHNINTCACRAYRICFGAVFMYLGKCQTTPPYFRRLILRCQFSIFICDFFVIFL